MKMIVFTIEVDSRSKLLASNIGWLKSLANRYENLLVVATHVGEIPRDFPSNIELIELRGGSWILRIKAIMKLVQIVFRVCRRRHSWHIFHHMIHYTAIFPGIIFKAFGYPQALWYSHKLAPRLLKPAYAIVDVVVSTALTAFPLRGARKVNALGHGLDNSRFSFVDQGCSDRDFTSSVVYLGRLSRIKNLERLFEKSISKNIHLKSDVNFIGPITDANYVKELTSIAKNLGVFLRIMDPIDYEQVPSILSQYSYFFSGTDASLDKSALEAAMCGCIIISNNRNLLKITGMIDFWTDTLGSETIPHIADQISLLDALSPQTRCELRRKISETTKLSVDIDMVTKKLYELLLSVD